MALSKVQQDCIDSRMQFAIYNAFEGIYSYVEYSDGVKPSEIARYLDTGWGLGDIYREWWESEDEEEWT